LCTAEWRCEPPELLRNVRRSKGIADLEPEEVEIYRKTAQRRVVFNRVIKKAFMKTGPWDRPLE